MDTINEKIKLYRKKNGWTQTYMAQRMGITQSAYSQFESANTNSMRVATLRNFCVEFQINPSWLMGLSDDIELK